VCKLGRAKDLSSFLKRSAGRASGLVMVSLNLVEQGERISLIGEGGLLYLPKVRCGCHIHLGL